MIRPRTTAATTIWISLLLTGCLGGGKDAILPQQGPTMQKIYDGHFKDRKASMNVHQDRLSRRPPGDGAQDLDGYSRDAHNELQNVFPRLENPVLVMYVYPHLSRDGHPVPGYATAFPMYEQVEFALPGEVRVPDEFSKSEAVDKKPVESNPLEQKNAQPGARNPPPRGVR